MSDVRGQDDGSVAVGFGIVICFLLLAGWFWVGSDDAHVPEAPTPVVLASDILPGAVRVAQDEHPVTVIGGIEQRCNACHGLFDSAEEAARRLTQHQHVVLDHGLNDRCYNCHDREDRERLALRGDETVPFTQVDRLCAKCHGPTWRDWQAGMHGKSMGGWNPASPSMRRLRCSECHDPHAPAFQKMIPLPGPHALRVDKPEGGHEGDVLDVIDPLRKWQQTVGHHGHSPAPDDHEHADHAGEGGAE